MIKELFKNILKQFDYRLIKISKNQNSLDILNDLIIAHDIDLVLDIGANEGQFAKDLRKNNYANEIISFEPVETVYKKLMKNSLADKKWNIYERCCLGEFDGITEINVSNYSLSSSILDFSMLHTDAKSSATMIEKEKVKITKLDTVAETISFKDKKILLKIDTQGYESQILEGGDKFLKNVNIVFCELSIYEVYKGQLLFGDIIKRLEKYNFKLASIENGFSNKKTKQLLQVDAIFVKLS
ncbi:FkbM family methyltransferase [Candidatus Pelagibacter sp.]|nr:FkbM family methyltransferase [Candidatus Pelagibacter sp.]